MDSAKSFLQYRQDQEVEHLRLIAQGANGDLTQSLITVELNITEMCNRTCVFCPRSNAEVYPNRRLHMTEATATKVAQDLASMSYVGRVSFSGFGENFMHPRFIGFVEIFRSLLPNNTIECNTNGDFLTVQCARDLFDAGLSQLYINLYDSESQREHFHYLMGNAGINKERYRLRDHWVGAVDDFGLKLNNRSGMVKTDDSLPFEKSPYRGKSCYYPFYKMLIDWNGKILFCSNDWGRKIIVGDVQNQHVRDIWLSEELNVVRRRLMVGDRSQEPCNTCSVAGDLHGKSSFDLLSESLKKVAS